jgi:hypothetical protein
MTAALLPAGVAAMGETAAVAGPGSDPGGCCCCRLLSGPSPLLPSLLLPLGGLSPGGVAVAAAADGTGRRTLAGEDPGRTTKDSSSPLLLLGRDWGAPATARRVCVTHTEMCDQ